MKNYIEIKRKQYAFIIHVISFDMRDLSFLKLVLYKK